MLTVMPEVEDGLRLWFPAALAAVGEAAVESYAGSTPGDMAGRSVTFAATGGGVIAVNVYRVTVSIDFRAASEAEAVRLGRIGAGLLGRLGFEQTAGSMTVTQVAPLSLPYLNPDPLNPSLHRVTALVELVVKGESLP